MQDRQERTTARVATWETRLHAPTSTTQVPVSGPSGVRTCPAAPVRWYQMFGFHFCPAPQSRGSVDSRASSYSRGSLLRQQSSMEQPSLPRIQNQRRPNSRSSQQQDMGFMDVPEEGAAGWGSWELATVEPTAIHNISLFSLTSAGRNMSNIISEHFIPCVLPAGCTYNHILFNPFVLPAGCSGGGQTKWIPSPDQVFPNRLPDKSPGPLSAKLCTPTMPRTLMSWASTQTTSSTFSLKVLLVLLILQKVESWQLWDG